MRVLGVQVEENPFYAAYDDECWMTLASAIMESYADKYAYQIPVTAFSQAEYSKLDKSTYLPIRQHVLRNIKNGPLRNVVNMCAIYDALEQRRIAYKQSMGVIWQDNEYENPF